MCTRWRMLDWQSWAMKLGVIESALSIRQAVIVCSPSAATSRCANRLTPSILCGFKAILMSSSALELATSRTVSHSTGKLVRNRPATSHATTILMNGMYTMVIVVTCTWTISITNLHIRWGMATMEIRDHYTHTWPKLTTIWCTNNLNSNIHLTHSTHADIDQYTPLYTKNYYLNSWVFFLPIFF